MRGLRAVVVLAASIGIGTLAIATASAQDDQQIAELALTPTSGPRGTVITVTGRCIFEGQPGDRAFFTVSPTDGTTTELSVDSFEVLAAANGDIDGSYTIDLPPRLYRLSGSCQLEDFFFGEPFRVDFLVEPSPETTTTTTTTTPTVSTTAPVPSNELDRTG